MHVCSTLWWPSGKHRHLVSVGGETLIMWDIGAPQKFFQVVCPSTHLEHVLCNIFLHCGGSCAYSHLLTPFVPRSYHMFSLSK